MFRFGAAYYPEQWPEERWPEDARLMQEAGFNVVRLAEFAWAKLEPSEGRFDFDWLDRAIGLLARHGIAVVLGTPTASPPPWVMAQSAELFRVGETGVRQTFGLRREYCPTHPLYRRHAERIASALAEHYRGDPAVIGWQVDNELGERCYCPACRAAFQDWLRARYATLDELNERWGTAFWSHTYSDWSQIPLPLSTASPGNVSAAHNPGLALDYRRFMSDTYCDFQKQQAEVIRQRCPHHFITHNLMGFGFGQINYFDLAAGLDFVAWDSYMRHQWDMRAAVDPAAAALSGDAMRGLKKRNTWIMEQQAGGGGWEHLAVPPKPGELRLWTYQSIAHGADGILYFRWRTARAGAEQHWQGILEPHGSPGRRYAEVRQVGEIEGSQARPRAALIQSYDSRFAFQVQPNNPRFRYEDHLRDVYRGFHALNVPLDVISENDPLTGYRLVVAPALYVLSKQTTSKLADFARAGGTVVFTPRSGVKDEFNTTVNTPLPGLLAEMCGIEIEECVSMPVDRDNRVQFTLPELADSFPTSVWADVIEPKGAKVIARHLQDFYACRPAATIHRFGEGAVIYLGVLGDSAFCDAVARWLSELAGVKPLLVAPPGVEVAERWQGERRILFVLNHGEQSQTVKLDVSYRNLLDDRTLSGEVQVAPFGVLSLTPFTGNA